MKKMTICTVILSLVLTFTACGEENSPGTQGSPPAEFPVTAAENNQPQEDNQVTENDAVPDVIDGNAPSDNQIPTHNSADLSDDWKDWFSISYGEWFGGNSVEPLRMEGGGALFQHPQDCDSILTFSGFDFADNDYPVRITISVSRLLGTSKTSVEELKKIYGDKLEVEDFGMTGWAAQVVDDDGFSLFFLLTDENDINITSVDIGKK